MIFRQIAAWLPRTCLLCGGTADTGAGLSRLCADCALDLPWHTTPACPRCAAPTPAGQVCGVCLKRPPAFDATLAALAYAFPVDRLIARLKYHGQLAIAPLLADVLAVSLRGRAGPGQEAADRVWPDRLIAMPAHPARLRERGFHHAAEIARELANRLALRLDTAACSRVRDTPPQQGLKFDARRRNLRGAFACPQRLTGQHIALIDDVMTTGTSLDELALTLKRAGAQRVENWVVARALPRGH